MAILTYDNNGYVKTYGQIFIGENLDELTIMYDKWSSKDGFMIAYPAKSREEALEISNYVMKDFIK